MKTKELQKLHLLSVKGGILTGEEQIVLQKWYETLNREENLAINKTQQNQNSGELRKQLTAATKQVTKISREIESLVNQNANLRNENQRLKKAVEVHLSEKAA